MNRRHLWKGGWINDAELEARLPLLSGETTTALEKGLSIDTVLGALDTLNRHLRSEDDVYCQILDQALSTGNMVEKDIREQLKALEAFTEPDNIRKKLKSELGATDPFTPVRIDFKKHIFESWAPLGLLVHVAPTNVFTVGVLSLIEGLMSGNVNFLKTSGSDTEFPQFMIKALVDSDHTGVLRDFAYVGRIPSRRTDLLKILFSQADGIAAWGGEEAIAGVRAMAPQGARVIEWGHKISFAYVAKESLNDPSVLEPIALECCQIEQQACSSPQCIYAETDSREELVSFGRKFAEALDNVSKTVPRVEPGIQEQAEITTVTELCRLESCLDSAMVIEADDGAWRILIDFRSALRASPLYRTVWLKPLLRDDIVPTLRPMRHYLQTVGLACSIGSIEEISRLMISAGALRISPAGRMHTGGYTGEPHDGVYALQRYSRRTSIQADDYMRGVGRFSELKHDHNAKSVADLPVMKKEDFVKLHVDDRYAHLFFKSGGTSGKPKLSVFTYDDYHAQMHTAAEGLYAAGLEPSMDRCINLFAAGHLYGGFLSFFTMLEYLGAAFFPMAFQDDLVFVGETITSNRINTVLGVPSYLMRLFQENRESFKQYRGIKKVFYAGEQLGHEQKKYLVSEFGVEVVRSAVYGSNDAGPMGYQCPHCEGSVHHLFTNLQILEILKLEEDIPVEGEEPGRLILTSLKRTGQHIKRYEIGDTGRWVLGPCPCGRQSPRFEILGRYGDIFRIGATPFLNYKQFVAVLQENMQYDGNVQIEIQGNKGFILYISEMSGLSPVTVRETVIQHYDDLRDSIRNYGGPEFTVRLIPESGFRISPHSGKLIHIVSHA